jgi:methionyl-tRNA formyltransferase
LTRIAFLGTSEFAAAVLHGLADRDLRPEVVVTRPDAPQGRGRRLAPPPVAVAARELGLEPLQPERVDDLELDVDEVVLCAYGALIKDPLLSRHEILNVHPSLLPRWRGAAPVERAIMAGDTQTGVCIMRLVAELDAGPVAARATTPIGPEDDFGSVSARLQDLAVDLLAGLVGRPRTWTDQEGETTYAEKLTAADRTLDLARPAAENARIVRALHGRAGSGSGARVRLADGAFLGVHEARVGDDGGLELVTVQPAGGRPMPFAEYVRGHGAPALA